MIEIYRSSRIETLADLLAAQMRASVPRSVLAPQRLIVGHLGMKRWLTQHLAEMRLPGVPRVAANLDMQLPSEWLDGLAHQVLGTEAIAIAPYRRPALRWRIYALLPQLGTPHVARYLTGDDVPRRRFQLADRLAGLYGQYLVYRNDWLQRWEAGARDGEPWQAELWRRVVAAIGQAHRGQRMRELAGRLASLRADPEQPALHVFGVSHLPPDALTALRALSSTRRICVYFPDPCRELWDDLRDRRRVYASALEGGAYLDIGHPLLASLGRIGQHFCMQLNELPAECDLRDHFDELADGLLPSRSPLLARLQHSIRTLRPHWLARRGDDNGDPRRDASLRVHSCHTRLRELEVLKDALLDALAVDPELHPRQIVVMAPNMALYAPLLPVVFGEPGDAGGRLPWQLADVALVRTHPLLSAVRELLDLPTQRISRSQVLALLALPAVARRFGLSDQRHAALARWLARSHVAWGLDGAMKSEFGAAPVDAHSFAFGMDRMAAGFLLGHESADVLLDDAILPADPVQGPDAECLGALSALIDVLQEWRARSRQAQPLARWAVLLRGWFERLFLIDLNDDGERDALAAVMALAARLGEESRAAELTADIDWTVVREVLKQGLDGIPERQAFLAGGITFCGMVPQRAIPFALVALLGLNDGDYPRPRVDSGLDLMQAEPRLGDRDNRSDDRYLFLEALMSARRALHLSYIGESPNDGKPRNPALPLAELLGFLDQQHGLDAGAPGYDPPWRVRHPLQPFDASYFDPANRDPRRYSYSREFADLRRDTAASDWRFYARTPLPLGNEAAASVELAALAAYFRDPARYLCKQALKLSRDALEAAIADDGEPLASDIHYFDSVRCDLVWAALHDGVAALPETAPADFLCGGRYASGELGRRTWDHVREQAQALLTAARALPPFAHGAAQATAQAVDLAIDGLRVLGSIGNLYLAGEQLWLVALTTSGVSFRQLLPLYLHWAALKLTLPDRPCHLRLIHRDSKDTLQAEAPIRFASDPDALRAGLRTLLGLYRNAEHSAGIYYARTSYAYALGEYERQASTAKSSPSALLRAQRTWAGSAGTHHGGERDYLPLYNALLAGDESFLAAGSADNQRFEALARTLLGAITGADVPVGRT